MRHHDSTEISQKIKSVAHWYHQIEIAPGIVTPGINPCREVLKRLGLPVDCKGLSVLDIGARDGFFSFELERRGAEVLAVDYESPDRTGFNVARDLLGSHIKYEVANVYELSPERFGTFDIVLFLGVLYHLRNPLLALDKIWSVCKDTMWLESHVMDEATVDVRGELKRLDQIAPKLANLPIMQFFARDELNKDFSNWWAPNCACVIAMLESSSYIVKSHKLYGSRAVFQCQVTTDPQREYHRRIERSIVP